jgi:hypothetical protein
VLRFAALGVVFVSVVFWLFGGAHLGYSQTRVPTQELDSATGRIQRAYLHRFVPGLDFLAASWVGAGLLLGGSFLAGRE